MLEKYVLCFHVLFVPGTSDLLIGRQLSEENRQLAAPEHIARILVACRQDEGEHGDDDDDGKETEEGDEFLPEDKAANHIQDDNQERGKTVFQSVCVG